MIESVNDYLRLLRKELAGSDPATVRDALADAEEHLRTALDSALETEPDISEVKALAPIIEEYGSPEETAAAYREIEARVRPALARPQHANGRPPAVRFFSVYADPRAWGALLYMFFSILTGLVYFSWAVIGLSFSLSMMILIIGVPVTIIFLLSVRGIAFVEGRLVEAVLGVRMPRRSVFAGFAQPGVWEQLKALVIDQHTWLSILYLILMLPLGICYFSMFAILVSLSVSLVITPVLDMVFNVPVIYLGNGPIDLPDWLTPLVSLGGAVLLTTTMHLARLIGRAHGRLAKAMLVSEVA
jgi:hypothetical protein